MTITRAFLHRHSHIAFFLARLCDSMFLVLLKRLKVSCNPTQTFVAWYVISAWERTQNCIRLQNKSMKRLKINKLKWGISRLLAIARKSQREDFHRWNDFCYFCRNDRREERSLYTCQNSFLLHRLSLVVCVAYFGTRYYRLCESAMKNAFDEEGKSD